MCINDIEVEKNEPRRHTINGNDRLCLSLKFEFTFSLYNAAIHTVFISETLEFVLNFIYEWRKNNAFQWMDMKR